MHIQCACMRVAAICLHVSDCSLFLGVGSPGWTWGKRVLGRLKVRHDAAVRSEWVPLASRPAAAWISFWNSYQRCLTSLLCLFGFYLWNGREQKSNLERADNREQDWIELLWLFGCNYSITIDKMTVFSLSSFNFSLLNNRRPEFWWEHQLEINFVCRAAWQHATALALIKSTLRHI